MVRGSRSDLPGLQAERTTLAWERTALALLANGVLLLLQHVRDTGWSALPVSAAGIVLAVACVVLGTRRGRRIRSGGTVPVARAGIVVTGISMVIFCLAVTAILVAGATG